MMDEQVFKTELKLLTKHVNNLEDDVLLKASKIDHLKHENNRLSVKNEQKNSILYNKTSRIASLDKSLKEAYSRIKLGKNIIDKKEKNIRTLKGKIQQMHSIKIFKNEDLSSALNTKRMELVELEGIMNIYKENLLESINKSKAATAFNATLEGQINLIQLNLLEKNSLIENSKKNFFLLKKKLDNLEKKLSTMNDYPQESVSDKTKMKLLILDLQIDLKKINNVLLNQIKEFEKLNPYLVLENANQ